MVYVTLRKGYMYNIFEYGSSDYKFYVNQHKPTDNMYVYIECRTGMTSIVHNVKLNDVSTTIDKNKKWDLYDTLTKIINHNDYSFIDQHTNIYSPEIKSRLIDLLKLTGPNAYNLLSYNNANFMNFIIVLVGLFKEKLKKLDYDGQLNKDESILYSMLISQEPFIKAFIDRYYDDCTKIIESFIGRLKQT